MSDDANNLAVSNHLLKVPLDGLLTEIILPLLRRLRERLLLALVPAETQKVLRCKYTKRRGLFYERRPLSPPPHRTQPNDVTMDNNFKNKPSCCDRRADTLVNQLITENSRKKNSPILVETPAAILRQMLGPNRN